MTPAELSDFKDWPKVERFVKKRISMQYEDLRKLMQERGFNLLAVAGLCDLVSGLSVSLHKPPVTKKWIVVCGTKKQVDLGTGDLFKILLEAYYPWQKGERRKRKSEIIYKFVRNPLAHSLGVGKKSDRSIKAAKCKKDKDNNVNDKTDIVNVYATAFNESGDTRRNLGATLRGLKRRPPRHGRRATCSAAH